VYPNLQIFVTAVDPKHCVYKLKFDRVQKTTRTFKFGIWAKFYRGTKSYLQFPQNYFGPLLILFTKFLWGPRFSLIKFLWGPRFSLTKFLWGPRFSLTKFLWFPLMFFQLNSFGTLLHFSHKIPLVPYYFFLTKSPQKYHTKDYSPKLWRLQNSPSDSILHNFRLSRKGQPAPNWTDRHRNARSLHCLLKMTWSVRRRQISTLHRLSLAPMNLYPD
jgi:hypothetical protein